MKKTDVKYRYAHNLDHELIEIHKAHAVGGDYYCPQCGSKMICKCGSKKAWHFAHDKVECDYNNYLHTIAEERIFKWFNTSREIPLVLQTNRICENHRNCKFFREESCCMEIETEEFNLKDYYTLCEKEKSHEKNGHRFVADLLCLPKNDKNDPLFIEICVTHPCEEEKLNSGLRIIEFVIKSEDDVDLIIEKHIKTNDNIRLYNFHPGVISSSPNTYESLLEKFILFPSKKGYTKKINCSELSERRGIMEITIPYNGYDPEFMGDGGFFSIAFAVAIQYDKSLRHCCLCKYHVYDDDSNGICKLYKKYGTNRNSMENDAQQCSYYRIDEESVKARNRVFGEYQKLNPVDIWVKRTN